MGLDLIIHKDPNDYQPQRLRPILLFDIEANMHKKALGQYTINHAEELKGIPPEHYGSRKAKAADVKALNNRLLYNLVRQKKVTSRSVFADLISNYDLVVHRISSLALQRVNSPKEPIHCKFITLHNMVHLVRTAFGDSANTYGGDIWAIPLKPPPQGLVQGNGEAPEIWAIVSSPLLNFLIEAGHGAVFRCSISQDSFHLLGYYFVDDSTIIQVEPSPETPLEEMVKLSQKGLNIFAGEYKVT